jgi:glycosyltransferase involved in cell wall biosynthesis
LAKRGLLVTYYFPPTGGGGVQRWVKFLKYLSGYGWEFSVITSDHRHSIPIDESLIKELPENIKIIRTGNSSAVESIQEKARFLGESGYWQRWASAFFRITDSRKSWNRIAKKHLFEELEHISYDVIILSSPPYSLALLAAEINQSVNCPVFFDLRDPWTINPYKIYPTKFHHILDERREKKAISKINFLISAYQSTIDNYQKRIKNFGSKKVQILPNGYDEADFRGLKRIDPFNGGKYNIGFSGSIYSHLNVPQPVFNAISRLKNDGIDIHFHHVGNSVYDLSKLAKQFKIEDNVHLWGYNDHKKSLQILQMMDALCLILDDRLPYSENTIGGKVYEYLRLMKPIFAVIPENGEAARIIKKTNSGVVVSARNNEKIVQELISLIHNKQDFTWKGIEEFNREQQAEVLNSFLEAHI